jgi:uncharacterized protein (DUF2384 family)
MPATLEMLSIFRAQVNFIVDVCEHLALLILHRGREVLEKLALQRQTFDQRGTDFIRISPEGGRVAEFIDVLMYTIFANLPHRRAGMLRGVLLVIGVLPCVG